MMVQKYEQVIKSLVPTPQELQIIQAVKMGIESDNNKSPWDNAKWYKGFTSRNEDGIPFSKAPRNKLLMVVSESAGTLYNWLDRGTGICRGSIIIVLEDKVVFCSDAYTWYATSYGASFQSVQGLHTLDKDLYGMVKEIKDVKP